MGAKPLSRSDFNSDKKKTLDFQNKGQRYKLEALERGELEVNHFWYVTPPCLIDVSNDLPSFAGLIEIGTKVKVIKFPDRLHSRKASFESRYKIAQKANNRFWSLRQQCQEHRHLKDVSSQVSCLDLTSLNQALSMATWEECPTVEISTKALAKLMKIIDVNA